MKKIFLIGANDFLQGLFIHTLGPAGIQVLTIQTEEEGQALQDTPVDLIVVSLSWERPIEFQGAPICYMGTPAEIENSKISTTHFLSLPIAPLELQILLEKMLVRNGDSDTGLHENK